MTDDAPDAAERRLADALRGYGRVLVAFSGGVDSAVVLAVAQKALGDHVVALTGEGPTFPPEEAAIARDIVAKLGVRHVVVDTRELENEAYARNNGDRCYHCKTELFGHAERVRDELGFDVVVDGTVLDDLGDTRPGLRAAAERGVRHPLVEAGLHKVDVRAIARAFDLPVWDKPSFACLGSRFPVGTRVNLEDLRRVARAESALRRLGLRRVRVRLHSLGDDRLARVEVDPDEIAAAAALADVVSAACLDAGFRWATLDLVGYRGSTA